MLLKGVVLWRVVDHCGLCSAVHTLTGPKGGLFMEPTVLDGFVGELSGH